MSSKKVVEVARPFISADRHEARIRALQLYRNWYRTTHFIDHHYNGELLITVPMMKKKLREEYNKNRHITDPRVIDLLILKGQNDLRDVLSLWTQQCHIMGSWFKDTVIPQPKNFLDKFFSGTD